MSGTKDRVGYGRPPKDKQFKPGKSGNPKGRPTGSRNLATDLTDELSQKITVREGGQTQRLNDKEVDSTSQALDHMRVPSGLEIWEMLGRES